MTGTGTLVITGFLLSEGLWNSGQSNVKHFGCGEVRGSVTGTLSLETLTSHRTLVQQTSFNPKRNRRISYKATPLILVGHLL